ncbi:MAG: hypothetical protein QXJ69_00675 [Desulfurococcaceae archaeon]
MGRRRKRRKTIVKKIVKIPTVFECPRCASRTLSITLKKKDEYSAHAIIACGTCGLLDDEDFTDIPAIYQAVDVYAKFIDLYNSGRAKIKSVSESGANVGEGT